MTSNPVEVRVYTAKDPVKILDDIARAPNAQTWGVGERTVYSVSKHSVRVFYYPVSPQDNSAGILIGVVGDPCFIPLEVESQEARCGKGAIVDMTKQMNGRMDGTFLSLNRAARGQGC